MAAIRESNYEMVDRALRLAATGEYRDTREIEAALRPELKGKLPIPKRQRDQLDVICGNSRKKRLSNA